MTFNDSHGNCFYSKEKVIVIGQKANNIYAEELIGGCEL